MKPPPLVARKAAGFRDRRRRLVVLSSRCGERGESRAQDFRRPRQVFSSQADSPSKTHRIVCGRSLCEWRQSDVPTEFKGGRPHRFTSQPAGAMQFSIAVNWLIGSSKKPLLPTRMLSGTCGIRPLPEKGQARAENGSVCARVAPPSHDQPLRVRSRRTNPTLTTNRLGAESTDENRHKTVLGMMSSPYPKPMPLCSQLLLCRLAAERLIWLWGASDFFYHCCCIADCFM